MSISDASYMCRFLVFVCSFLLHSAVSALVTARFVTEHRKRTEYDSGKQIFAMAAFENPLGQKKAPEPAGNAMQVGGLSWMEGMESDGQGD